MKLLFLLFLLPFASTPISYRQLSWSDFKGNPPANTESYACTCTNIVIGTDTAYAIFMPDKSWTKTKDAVLLRHEQLHFKITELVSVMISRDLKKGIQNVQSHLDIWGKIETRYDKETDHGTDSTAQKRWEETIKL